MFQVGAKVVYSKYAGTDLEFNDTNHLIMKEDDIIGVLDTDDVKDLKPLGDRVLIKVCLETYYFDILLLSGLFIPIINRMFIRIQCRSVLDCTLNLRRSCYRQIIFMVMFNFRIMALWCSIYFNRKSIEDNFTPVTTGQGIMNNRARMLFRIKNY